jgi:AcrR family transcriptional regulator
VTVRGEETRQQILDVAERLFSERGCDAVSLREIRLAAGARNTAAIQFHFGDRDGLIDALTARHMPRIGALQQDLYDEMVAEGRQRDMRSLVEVLVRPSAEYLRLGPSERAWVKIMADLSGEPDLLDVDMRALAPTPALEVTTRLFERLASEMPLAIAAERMFALASNSVQICADRARIEDEREMVRQHVPIAVFVENLVDMIHGALFAPVSAAATTALDAAPKPRRKTPAVRNLAS